MVKVQKIAPYNFEFRKISVLSSQIDCSFTSAIDRVKKSEMSDFCNQNVRSFALFVQTFTLKPSLICPFSTLYRMFNFILINDFLALNTLYNLDCSNVL